jgi:hypothetical protein
LRQLGYTQPAFAGVRYDYFHRLGLSTDADWYWTYDVFEWSLRSSQPMYGIDSLEKVYARMDEDLPEGHRGLNFPGSDEIILMHDHAETHEYFQTLIDRLAAKDLTFARPN